MLVISIIWLSDNCRSHPTGTSDAVIHNEQRDMAVGQMQHMSPQRHGCIGNTSVNNEDGNDNVEFNELRTEDHPGMFMVPNISFFNHQLALRDAKGMIWKGG